MDSPRPAIGIVTALEQARYGVWDVPAALSPFSYIAAIQAAGGLAVMIPPDARLAADPDEMLDRIDGLLLAGGGDVGPDRYGQASHPETGATVPARDELELALVTRAIERDLPVLGICRGMQLINVARGGTLLQHLPGLLGHEEHRRALGSFDGADHDVDLTPGSLAERVAGEARHQAKSHHHQGIDRVGQGLLVSGRCPLDDLPEAIELPDKRFVLGVQWHPEADLSSPVVGALVAAAREAAEDAAGTASAAPM